MPFELAPIQSALRAERLSGWLLYDFRGSNVLARRIVDLEHTTPTSRRWVYWIPADGVPQRLVHAIEPGTLDHLPGDKKIYLSWQSFESGIAACLAGATRVAMEYSPRNALPTMSRVDAGTVELVRALGPEVVSSADLIQLFEAVWTPRQWVLHQQAAEVTNAAYELVWEYIAAEVLRQGQTTELAVQSMIMDFFRDHGLTTYHPPIVAANAHSGDPHYEPTPATNHAIVGGDFVLVDLWAKVDDPDGVYSDLTRVGFVGDAVPDRYSSVFKIVANARDAAINLVKERFAAQRPLLGSEVDQAARQVIVAAGYGEKFVHRTGHSIGRETHGNGANMDSLETNEPRRVLPGTCFSIEPGIYLPDFGVRLETNLFIDWQGNVHVTGGELQSSILPIFG